MQSGQTPRQTQLATSPNIAMIVNEPHKQYMIQENTAAYTSFNMSHIVKSVNQSHKHHATRADTTAYTEHKVHSNQFQEGKRSEEASEEHLDEDKEATKTVKKVRKGKKKKASEALDKDTEEVEKNESSKEEVKSLVTQLHTRKKAKHPGGKQQTKITKFFRRQQVKSAPPSPPKKHSYSPLVPPPSLTPKVRKIAQKGAKSKIGKSSKRKSDGKLPEQKNKISDMFSLKTKKTDNSDQPVVLTLATQTWLGH